MTKKELTKSMQDFTGCSFITKAQLMTFMGYKSPNSVTKYLHPLQRVDKRYYIPDVAEEVLSCASYAD
ncbi:MAG: hypothetical protein ACI4WY_05600 [Anaerovoracaceae bacterium]